MTLSYFYSSFIWDFLSFGLLLLLFCLCFFLWFWTYCLCTISIAAALDHVYKNYKNYIIVNLNSLDQVLIHVNTKVVVLLFWMLLVFFWLFKWIFTFFGIWNSVIDNFLLDFLFVSVLFELSLFMSFSFRLFNIIITITILIFGYKRSFGQDWSRIINRSLRIIPNRVFRTLIRILLFLLSFPRSLLPRLFCPGWFLFLSNLFFLLKLLPLLIHLLLF